MSNNFPDTIPNWIGTNQQPAKSGETFDKFFPATGEKACECAKSSANDVDEAVRKARSAQEDWASRTPVERGDLLRDIALQIRDRSQEFAEIVAAETGKSVGDAMGETGAAMEMGFFVAGEGRRFYGRTTTSAAKRWALTMRQPIGVAGLIIAANTPIANVAWKAFPALMCGNSAIMKASENTPLSAWLFGQVCRDVGLPDGVFSVIQGLGPEAGEALVQHPDVDIVSFTGSAPVGKHIQVQAGGRLAKVCLELGGKNALFVCDDADIDAAVNCAWQSAFTNAGQRCASGSRIVIFEEVYETFKEAFLAKTNSLKVGSTNDDDFGPVISESQLTNMLRAIDVAKNEGTLLTGGNRLQGGVHQNGYFLEPTIFEGLAPDAELSCSELFGPITALFKVKDFEEGLALVNNSDYGLTSSIHTKSVHRAMEFMNRVRTGVVSVNGNTHGSEPHMPFGGLKDSGNGAREAGTEALDVYSDWKTVYIHHMPDLI